MPLTTNSQGLFQSGKKKEILSSGRSGTFFMTMAGYMTRTCCLNVQHGVDVIRHELEIHPVHDEESGTEGVAMSQIPKDPNMLYSYINIICAISKQES